MISCHLIHYRMTTPCRRVAWYLAYSFSSSSEQSPSEDKPQTSPPQSILTLSPARVMPYVLQLQSDETDEGLEQFELRELLDDEEDVSDGTLPKEQSESTSDSSDDPSSSKSELSSSSSSEEEASLAARASRVA